VKIRKYNVIYQWATSSFFGRR